MRKDKKRIPTFASEADERRFWEKHDSTYYLDWSRAQRVRLPNLRPSTKSLTARWAGLSRAGRSRPSAR